RIADMNPDIYGIIFCRTRMETKEVAEWLIKDGYNADALHGDLSQAQRDQVMNRFRLKNLQMLVATDVAARGLDVNDLTHVINYNLPDDIEVYTHRSGRTGRAGKAGISVAIVHLKEKYRIKEIERKINKKFEVLAVPTGKEICKKQLFHLIEKMEKVEVNHELIDEFLPEVNKKLAWLERDELIKHFVSLEFNRFLEYYKNATDLNAPDERFTEYRERDGDRRRRGERSSNRNDRSDWGDRGDRGDRGDSRSKDFKRLFVNIGKNQGLNPQRLMGLVNEATREKNIPVGKIDIMKSFSFFEIDNQFVDKVMNGLNTANFDGVKVSTEIANEKPQGDSGRGDRRSSGRDRSERKPFDRDRSERKSFGRDRSEKRSSESERPERKSFDRERPEWKQFDRDNEPKRSESGKRPRTKRK
ncbi:MAG: helicase-related protein, partial [Bacteroidales bacterium]|nr:helicase-related protein [Bacteroidales bacterium]